MKLCLMAMMLLAARVFAGGGVYEVGDTVQNMCWTNDENKQVCLDDYKNTVRVLVYNAGWCGPCNEEFDELSPRVREYEGKPVTFISLSAAGYSRNAPADQSFLQSWRQRHGIPAGFVVAASPRDYGTHFGQNAIPNAAVVDANGKLTYKDVAPGVDGLFQEINKVLQK
jgi:peroxiredoxin